MQIKEILALERAGEGDIILHRKGIFWRAHQNSAFLFHTHLRPLKVTVKFMKVVHTGVAYLGFPRMSQGAVQVALPSQTKELPSIVVRSFKRAFQYPPEIVTLQTTI